MTSASDTRRPSIRIGGAPRSGAIARSARRSCSKAARSTIWCSTTWPRPPWRSCRRSAGAIPPRLCDRFRRSHDEALLPEIARQGVKVVSNAGGLNPAACAAALRALIDAAGLSLTVAVVEGDDVSAQLDAWRAAGVTDIAQHRPLPDKVLSANAYLGAFPIAQALKAGADIVVTGRCVDSAVTLGALIHEFGWQPDGDWDRLAQGSLAGHLIECACQATGGLHTDWQDVPDWPNIGYPVVEVSADGRFALSKPPGTGGRMLRAAVVEQLLYEIGDPADYRLPDVTCDFTQVHIAQDGADLVRVEGARGRPPRRP